MNLSLKIDQIQADDLTETHFRKNYLLPQKPLLIKGLATQSPAGKKWTLDYFRELAGEEQIEVFDNRVEKHKRTTMIQPDVRMKLADFLNIISRNEYTPYRMFVFNFFKLRPELRKDFPCPGLIKGFLDSMGYFFMGGKNTEVRAHFDIDCTNVLLTQFYGKKRVVLIHPKYTDFLYRLPFTTQTDVDIALPDYEKYPALQFVQGYEFIQEAGDAVFMPARWWHYMTYLEGGIAVSYRKLHRNPFRNLQGFINLGIVMPFDKVMSRIMVESWFRFKKGIAFKRATMAIRRIKGL